MLFNTLICIENHKHLKGDYAWAFYTLQTHTREHYNLDISDNNIELIREIKLTNLNL